MRHPDERQLIDSVLSTWFKDNETGRMDLPQKQRWFMGGKTLDELLSARFGQTVQKAQAGEFDHWLEDIRGAMAYVILLDQFSRNIYRGAAQAFAGDARALSISQHVLSCADYASLPLTNKVFLFMPFEHDENSASQQTSVALFTDLRDQAPPSLARFAQATLDSAIEHKAIIDQFGRYPHRNATLGRPSTAAEISWLSERGKSFGQ